MKTRGYKVVKISDERMEFLKEMNPRFKFTGEAIQFTDTTNGIDYPVITGQKWTPYHFARKVNKRYVVATYAEYWFCKNGVAEESLDGK